MMNADRLFMLVDTCANIDEVKHEFPNLDFLTYFYALLGLLMMLLAGSVVYFGKSYFEYKLREE